MRPLPERIHQQPVSEHCSRLIAATNPKFFRPANSVLHTCPVTHPPTSQQRAIHPNTRTPPMRIGELAALTGCTPKALRLYEAHGLLGTVARQGSYRIYGPEDVQRVQWIRQALALGFRLAALQPLRTMDTPAGAAAVLALLQTRRRAIADELQRLQAADTALAALALELSNCDAATECPAPDQLGIRRSA